MQVSILGLLVNDPATVPDGFHGHRAILCNPKRYIFGDNKNFGYLVVPLNNFATISNCPLVQRKSNKPPPPLLGCVCVCVGGANSYSIIVPLFLVS